MSVKDRTGVASGLGAAPPPVRGAEVGPSREEPVGIDVVGTGGGQRGHFAQGVPLQRRVLVGGIHTVGGVDEPSVNLDKVFAGGEPQTQIGPCQEVSARS